MVSLTKYQLEWRDKSDIESTTSVLSTAYFVSLVYTNCSDETLTPTGIASFQVSPPKARESNPLRDEGRSRVKSEC